MKTYELIARYLAGECNEAEKKEIEKWMQENPQMMDELSGMWEQIPSHDFNPDVEQALQHVNQQIDSRQKNMSKSRSVRLFAWVGSVAAVALILIISVIMVMNRNTSVDIPLLALQTGVGETLEYTLPDGSKVWLNQSSHVNYPESFSGSTREIHLEGEAFFDVMPDAEKPFIIHANNTRTLVVGTSFGIRAVKGEDEVVVTVSTGVVNLSANEKNDYIELRKGEQGMCNPEEKILVKNTDADPNLLAWKTKVLVFKNSPLTEVAKVIEDAYQTTVSVDASIENLQINATYNQLPLEDIIQIIEMTLQVEVQQQSKEHPKTPAGGLNIVPVESL